MFFVYLFAAVAGCLLVLVSVFSGGNHDGGGDPGGGHTLDASSAQHSGIAHNAAHSHADGHPAHAADATPGGLGAALGWLLSVQLWTYLLAFGGLTGLLLRTLAHVAEPVAGGCALAVGLGTALAARSVMRRVIGNTDSGTTSYERLVGSSAQVLIPAGPGGTGKVRLTARGQTIDLLARASDGGELPADGTVSILDVRDGVAEVTRDDEPPVLAGPTAAAAAPLSASPSGPGPVAGAAQRKKDSLANKG